MDDIKTEEIAENTEKETVKNSIGSFFKSVFSKIKNWFVSVFKYILLGIIIFVSFIIGKKVAVGLKEKDDKLKDDIKDNFSSNKDSLADAENNVTSAEEKINEVKQDLKTDSDNIKSEIDSFNEKQKEKLEKNGFKKEVKDE